MLKVECLICDKELDDPNRLYCKECKKKQNVKKPTKSTGYLRGINSKSMKPCIVCGDVSLRTRTSKYCKKCWLDIASHNNLFKPSA